MVCQTSRHCWCFSIQGFVNAAEIKHGNKQRNRITVIFHFL